MLHRKEEFHTLMEYPVVKKSVGIIRLQMVKEYDCLYDQKQLTNSKAVVQLVKPLFFHADRELMVVISLSSSLEPLAMEIVAIGGLNNCYIDLKNIFKHALLNNAGNIICVHNHPSGSCVPSKEDISITKRIQEAGKLLDISLLDHLILTEQGYYSFQEEKMME